MRLCVMPKLAHVVENAGFVAAVAMKAVGSVWLAHPQASTSTRISRLFSLMKKLSWYMSHVSIDDLEHAHTAHSCALPACRAFSRARQIARLYYGQMGAEGNMKRFVDSLQGERMMPGYASLRWVTSSETPRIPRRRGHATTCFSHEKVSLFANVETSQIFFAQTSVLIPVRVVLKH